MVVLFEKNIFEEPFSRKTLFVFITSILDFIYFLFCSKLRTLKYLVALVTNGTKTEAGDISIGFHVLFSTCTCL